MKATLLLHANLLYAEIPFSQIPRVVDRSYIPVLEAINRTDGIRIVLDFSGFTLELLAGEHPGLYGGSPRAITLLREGIRAGRVEITGTSWSHAVLPLMPPDLIEEDIRLYLASANRILGIRPRGFFPPELGICPLLPPILRRNGYSWSFLDGDFIDYTHAGHLNTANDFEPIPPSFGKLTAMVKDKGILSKLFHLREMKRRMRRSLNWRPIRWQGTERATVTGVLSNTVWHAYFLASMARVAVLHERKLLRMIDRMVSREPTGLFIPFTGDIEFYGFRGNTVKETIPVSRLESLFRFFSDHPRIELLLPSEYLDREPADGLPLYVKSGSWSSDKDFDLWDKDADNSLLNRLSLQAWERYRERADRFAPEERERLLKTLLLAYNSDGRGWAPLPEHRLFCFDKAMEAIRLHPSEWNGFPESDTVPGASPQQMVS